ncbi:unnamed protein product [Scytosiphon promiscuus]
MNVPMDPLSAARAAAEAEMKKQQEKVEAERENSLQEEVDAEVFSSYECRSLPRELGKTHPGDISEPGLLAAVALPPLTYGSEAFDGAVIDETKLSKLQLEGVLYAAQRHTHLLPDGKRAGFFIGDGAGVGKGRQIAGIILDSWARGRKKHVWFSISNDLKLDAQRDLKDVGCHISVIDGCQGLDAASSKGLGMSSSSKHGCLFSTYSTLASSRSNAGGKTGGKSGGSSKKSRLEQLADWCGGEDFEGCLVFDEAHKAKNFNSSKEELSTKVSQAVIKIQDMLPKARVVYCSATGVTDIGNLAYATRLGLWGVHSPFYSFKDFKESMETRGLGALEMLAMELKAKGAYVSRGLGWKGAEFETREASTFAFTPTVRLPPSTVLMYDKAVEFWMLLRTELEKAVAACGNSGMCKTDRCKNGHVCSPMRQFWGQQQRFFKEMANASKVEFVVDQTKEALSSGMSVVIGLQSTGESGMDKAMSEMNKKPGDTVSELISAAHYGTIGFIRQFFPTRTAPKEVKVITDQEIEETIKCQLEVHIRAGITTVFDARQARENLRRAQASSKALQAEHAKPREIKECVETKEKLIRMAKELRLLPSPLDALIDALGGPAEVAEMTGRRGRLVRSAASGSRLKFELRPENEETSLNIRERELFMSGKKKVAIISDAASTGVSLHAAVGSGSQERRRLHITLELPWSADKAIQQLGRSHRSNQASAPVFRLLVTDLGGERRFAAAVAKRLASLGALTKGDRRAATGADFSSFDLDTKYGRRALRSMIMAIATKTGLAPGVDLASLRPFIQDGLLLSTAPPFVPAGGTPRASSTNTDTGSASPAPVAGTEVTVEENLGQEAKAEIKAAIMLTAEQSLEDMAIEPAQYNNVTLFLGRLQGLPVRKQNLMFTYLTGALEAVLSEARAAGVYDEGVADLRASSVTLKNSPENVARDPATGATTQLAQVVLDRGVSWEQALAKRAEAAEAGMDEAVRLDSGPKAPQGTGFYRSRHTDISSQRKLVLLAVRKAKHNRLMVITRPNTGTSGYEMDLQELREKYDKVSDEEKATATMQHAWTLAYNTSDGADYRGSRKVTLGLLSGSVLPLWSALEKTVVVCRAQMTKAEEALKVNRVILDDSSKLVGVRLPITSLGTLRQHLTEAVQARQAVVDTGGGGKLEPVSPVDHKVLVQVKTPPKNILSFFGRAPFTSSSSVSTSRSSPSQSAVTPSPARCKRQTQGEIRTGGSMMVRSGSGGDDGGIGSSRGASSASNKRRKGSTFASGKGEKEYNNQTSVAKGLACLFGAQFEGSFSGSRGGSASSSIAVESIGSVTPMRKNETPEVISIDDD